MVARLLGWLGSIPRGLMHGLAVALEQHKLIRRLAVIWAACLITFAVIRTFEDLTQITTPVVAALTAVIGILATVIGFYQHSRNKE